MQEPSWRGSHTANRAMRFDNAWPTLELFKGNDTTIYFAAKTSGPNVVLDKDGFELAAVDLTNTNIMLVVTDAENNDAVLLTKTNGLTGGITVTDALLGHLTIDILRTDFANVPAGIYNCEIAYQDIATTKVHTLAKTTLFLMHSIFEGVDWG